MKTIMKKVIRPLLFVVGGGAVGLLLQPRMGCAGGMCMTASPWLMALYTAVIGGILSVVFAPGKEKAT